MAKSEKQKCIDRAKEWYLLEKLEVIAAISGAGFAGFAITGPIGWAIFASAIALILIANERVERGYRDRLDKCAELSPLILDLDGDGVEADALTHFDHAGDGWRELSRWASADDGVLVWDRNNDGVINDDGELFGDNTALKSGSKAANGFAALADLDSNSDRVVDSSDAEWGNLRVMRWMDANNDGVMQDSESRLVTLDSLGVKSLETTYSDSDHVDKSGNEHRQMGSYTKADGTTAKMTDVWFVTSPGDTTYDDSGIPAHSAAIKALLDLAGRGRLYSLRDAMALDDAKDAKGNSRLAAPYYETTRTDKRSLREMVAAFVETDADGDPVLSKPARTALAEKILLRWAGAEGATRLAGVPCLALFRTFSTVPVTLGGR